VDPFVFCPLIDQDPVMRGPVDDEQRTERAVLGEDRIDTVLQE
jgi:hypothetical protein